MTTLKCYTCLVVLLDSMTAVGAYESPAQDAYQAITIANRTDRDIRIGVAYADVRGSRPSEMTLEARKDAMKSENRPLLVSFQSGGRTKQYVLVPGRNYHFADGDDGELDLHRTETAADALNPDRNTES